MLNNRLRKLLRKLETADSYLQPVKLAEEFHVTSRTIRSDLIKIEDFLFSNQLPGLVRDHQKGVKLCKSESLRVRLSNMDLQADALQYIYTKKEIKIFIVLKLLYECDPISPRYFEELFLVSRTTIFNILQGIEGELNDHQLKVVKIAKTGIKIHGNCVHKINEFALVMIKHCDLTEFYDFIDLNERKKGSTTRFFLDNLLNKNLYFYLKSTIVKIETLLQKTFDDSSYIKIILFLDKLIQSKLERVNIENQDLLPLLDTREYEVSNRIIEMLLEEFPFVVNKDTLYYLSLLLLTSKSEEQGSQDSPFLQLSYELIHKVEARLSCKMKDRNQLASFLSMHIQPMIYRYRGDIKIENPLFFQIVTDYYEVYEAVNDCCSLIEEYCGIQVSDQEASFIAMHFAGGMPQRKQIQQKLNIAVICVEGIAISNKIALAIKEEFDVNITGKIALRNLNETVIEQNDYLVSTIDIPIMTSKLIRISSEMNTKDKEVLATYIMRKPASQMNLDKVENLINSIKKWCEIKDLDALQYEILQVMLKEDKRNLTPRIWQMEFHKNHIMVQQNCKDWKEALYCGGQILIKQEYILLSYLQKIEANVKEFGGYMVIAPQIMLAHAGTMDGVFENTLSVVTLENSVPLKNQFHLPIKVVLIFAVTDEKSHLNFLKDLMLFVNDRALMQQLINSRSSEEVYKMFHNNVKF